MITLLAVVALFVYVWRTRADLDAAISGLTRRIEALESMPLPAPPRHVPAPVRAPAEPTPEPVEVPTVVLPPLPEAAPPEGSSPQPAFNAAVRDEGPSDSLESEIGSRWLLYVGVVALVIGAAYFQKLAIDNNWIGERARVIEGIVAGLLMVAGGRRFIARGYDAYGQIVAGGGVAVLYVSVYAAATLYELIGRGTAFVALSAVTVLAAVLADRHRSQGLAIMAVGGGFLTPFLLPSDRDAQVALFTYDAILVAATMYLAHRRVWPVLNVVSYVSTLLTVFAWAVAFYTPEKYLLTHAYLTAFCAMFLYILRQMHRSDAPGAREVSLVLWTAPAVYYVASLVVLGPHSIPLLIFLGILASIGAAMTPQGKPVVRLVVWIAVAGPLLNWASSHDDGMWLAPGLIAVSGIYLVNLLAHLYGLSRDERLTGPDVSLVHLNALISYVAAHWLLRVVEPSIASMLAFGFSTWNLAIAGILWSGRRATALHFAGLAATLLAIGIGLEFDGPARTIGWSVEGAALVWLGLREKRLWLHAGGLGVFAVAAMQLLDLLRVQPPGDYVVLLNARAACALFMVALLYLLAWIHRTAPERPIGPTLFVLAANILTLLLLTIEISAYWYVRGLSEPDGVDHLGREVMLSVSWALYATVLIVVGLKRRFAPIRYLAMTVFGLTIAKVFLFDLAELEQVYRVLSVIVLGALLLLTSYRYNRARKTSA